MTLGEGLERSAELVSRRLARWELGVDGAIHALAIVAGLIGAVALILIAAAEGGAGEVAVVAVYSTALLATFGCSAAYNLGRSSRHGGWLRCLDQTAIFLMIAATYTPFTTLHLDGVWRTGFTALVWSTATAGILLRLLRPRLFERISLAFYLGLGWISVVALGPLVAALDTPTLVLLATGGLLYTAGLVFHLWERLPFRTAIWHLFVVAAAATHYAAVVVSTLSSAGGV
jgi:hemolysin III